MDEQEKRDLAKRLAGNLEDCGLGRHDVITPDGPLCQSDKCTALALVTVRWPGESSIMCEAHALHAGRVASAMGFHLATEPLR